MMSKAEKIVTMIVGIGGGLAGLWGAYTAHDSSKFRQPFDEREQVVNSFMSQIASAEKRSASEEVVRIRLELERYEESWRSVRLLTNLVKPIEELAAANLSDIQVETVRSLLNGIPEGYARSAVPPRTLGAAYLAVGDYSQAIYQFTSVNRKRSEIDLSALQAVAYGRLANITDNPELRTVYKEAATNHAIFASNAEPDQRVKVLGFFATDPGLSDILENAEQR